MATAHPKELKAFKLGWINIGPSAQRNWTSSAQLLGEIRGWDLSSSLERISYKEWGSWAQYQYIHLDTPKNDRWDDIESEVAELIYEKLDHSGVLFGLPNLPDVRQSLSNDGRFEDDRMLCQYIAEKASEIIVHSALDQLRTDWIEGIEKNGLDAVKNIISEFMANQN